MKKETAAHRAQRTQIEALLAAAGLGAHQREIESLLAYAIALRTRPMDEPDRALGATRVGGEPDLAAGVDWPEGEEGPLSFVLQVRLEQIAQYDVEELLPERGLLSVFSDDTADSVRVLFTDDLGSLARRPWARGDADPFTECGVDVMPELQLPPHSSRFVGLAAPASTPGSAKRLGSRVELPEDVFRRYWDDVWLKWRTMQRPGSAGEAGIHQLLGYAACDDTGEQELDEVVLVAFDSDDRAGMQWGDVQCVYTLIEREALRARRFDALRAVV